MIYTKKYVAWSVINFACIKTGYDRKSSLGIYKVKI